jgi:hypothetical protein
VFLQIPAVDIVLFLTQHVKLGIGEWTVATVTSEATFVILFSQSLNASLSQNFLANRTLRMIFFHIAVKADWRVRNGWIHTKVKIVLSYLSVASKACKMIAVPVSI